MNLPFFSKRSPTAPPSVEVFFVLRITSHQVQAGLWQSGEENSKLLAISGWADWDPQDAESLVKQADGCLAELSTELPVRTKEPNRVLFGVPASWVADQQLLPERKELLKQVTQELELKALGYAVTAEAMVNYLNLLERAPVAALVVGLEPHNVEVCLTVQGKVQHVIVKERLTSLTETLMQVLTELDKSQLPARIVLYDGKEPLAVLQSELLHYDWEKAKVGFLHLPKVDVYPAEQTMEALIRATGQEKSLPVPAVVNANEAAEEETTSEEITTAEEEAAETEKFQVGQEVSEEEAKEEIEEGPEKPLATEQEAEEEELKEEGEENHLESHSSAAAVMPVAGFVIGQDIREVGSGPPSMKQRDLPATSKHHMDSVDDSDRSPMGDEDTQEVKRKSRLRKPWTTWRLPRETWPLILLIVGTVSLVGSGLGYLFTQSSAEVTLSIKPQLLESTFTVVVDPELAEPDIEAGRLPGELLSAETTGAKSISTTGKKTVGERAKGEVTLFNDAESERTLDAGTILTSASSLKFTLDEKVKIASKSVDLASDTPFKPGTGKAKVTAAEIGAEYNLDANTSFSVANFSQSSVLARSSAAFAGGSSREVQSVAAEDQEKLLTDLQAELEVQAQEKLNQQLPEGHQLVTSSVTSAILKKTFDQKTDDVADKLSLDLSVKFSGVSYSRAQIDELIKQQLANRIPLDKQLAEGGSVDFKLQETEEDVYHFEVVTKSNLLPKLNPDNIKNKIKGKRPNAVKDYLFSLPSVSQVKHEIKPKLPGFLSFLNRFPFKAEKIEVKIVAEE